MTTANIKREPEVAVQSDDESEESNESLNTTKNSQMNVELRAQMNATNQKIVELTSQLDAMKNEKNQQYNHFDHQLRKMRGEVEEWKNKYTMATKQIEVLEKNIRDSKDLNSTAKRSKRPNLASSENRYYDVESLLDHKKGKGRMYYLVHWENYDSTHDSWERESNLKSLDLLKRYKNANNLN